MSVTHLLDALVDALTQYSDFINACEETKLMFMRILAKAIGRIQSLDFGFLRFWRPFVRRVSDRSLMKGRVDIYEHDDISKFQSLIHFQFGAPIYSAHSLHRNFL